MITATLNWIPIFDELPDEQSTVLIAEHDGEVSLGFLDDGDWRYDTAERVLSYVTHWADVPAHPVPFVKETPPVNAIVVAPAPLENIKTIKH